MIADHTYLSSAALCLKQWELRYKLHFRKRGLNPYLEVGSAAHKAMEVLYGPDGFDRVDEAVGACLAYLDGSGLLLPPGGEKLDYLSRGHIEVCLRNYADYYRTRETYKVVRGIEEPLVSEALGLGGIPDLIVEEDTGKVRIMDHKFTFSWLGKRFEDRVRHSYQLPLYCALVKDQLGLDVKSVVVNGVYLGAKASSEKFGGTRFARYHWTLFQSQIDEALVWKAQIERLLENKVYPRNRGSHCGGWCEFGEYCLAAPERRIHILGTDFVTWKPKGKLLSGADSS
jgi:hypothetical protein